MLDNEVQILERGGDIIDIGNIERIAVERENGRAFVDMDVLDAELPRRFEKGIGFLVCQFVALRLAFPFGGVELDAFELVLFRRRMQRFKAFGAVARVEGSIEDEPVRVALLHGRTAFGCVETNFVEIGQVGGLQNRHVVIACDEQVIIHVLSAVFFELILGPALRWWAQVGMKGIEAIDELLAMHIQLVRRTSVPEMGMSVNHENFFALGCLVHDLSPSAVVAAERCDGLRSAKPDGEWPALTPTIDRLALQTRRYISSSRSCRQTALQYCRRSSPCAHNASMTTFRTSAQSWDGPALRKALPC